MSDTATKPVLTYDKALEVLRELAAERPDYVYSKPEGFGGLAQCLYVHGDEPGCIVGHVLHRLGVPLEDVKPFDGIGPVYLLVADGYFPFKMDVRTKRLLDEAQSHQDAGLPWGQAVREAELGR